MLTRQYILLVTLLSNSLLFSTFSLQGQAFYGDTKFSATILKDTLQMSPGQFGFNSITIYNHSNEPINLSTKLSLPQGWSLLRQFPTLISVRAGQSVTVPFRIRTSSKAYGGIKYPINVQFLDANSGESTNDYFYANIVSNTSWGAGLIQNTKFVYDTEQLPDFTFQLKNEGNRVEAYDVSFESKLRLTFPQSGFQIMLKPGTDTTITVGVRSRTLDQISDEIRIHIQARNMKKILIQKIFIISNEYQDKQSKYQQMPISVAWRAANFLDSDNIIQFVESEGYLDLENNKAISFRYRSSPIGSRYQLNNDIYQLNFHFKKSNISLGSQQDFIQSQVDGTGIRADYNGQKANFEIFAIKNRLNNGETYGTRQDLFLGQKSVINSEAIYSNNKDKGLSHGLAISTFRYSTDINNQLSLSGGYSFEKNQTTNQQFLGHMYGGQLKAQKKLVNVISSFRHFSNSFPGFNRGNTNHQHDLRVNLGKLFIGAYGNQILSKPNRYNANFTEVTEQFNLDNHEYGAQLGARVREGNLFVRLAKLQRLQYSEKNDKVEGERLSLNYSVHKSKVQQVATVGITRSKFGELNQGKEIITLSSFLQGKYRDFGYNSRFDYGPSFYFDFLYYGRTGVLPVRHQHTVFYENSATKKLRNRVSLNYFDMSQASFKTLFFRNDFFWDIPKLGLNVNLSAGLNVLRITNRPNLSFTITKHFNTPVPFYKKYKSLEVSLFKDENNNDIWDEGEESVKEANVLINDKYLTTNQDGKLKLINVSKGNYVLNYHTIQNQLGWTAKSILRDTVLLDKDKSIVIPFKKSRIVTGQIKVSRAAYSNLSDPSIAGIRVLATNEKGDVFRSITNKQGAFFFNLNKDQYTIQVPKNLFGAQFRFTEESKTVDLYEKEQAEVSFLLKEKSRKLNIKKLRD